MPSTKTIRVLQGHSICYQHLWYNQGDVLEVDAAAEFKTTRPKYDEAGKYLGDAEVDQVETITTTEAPKSEEG